MKVEFKTKFLDPSERSPKRWLSASHQTGSSEVLILILAFALVAIVITTFIMARSAGPDSAASWQTNAITNVAQTGAARPGQLPGASKAPLSGTVVADQDKDTHAGQHAVRAAASSAPHASGLPEPTAKANLAQQRATSNRAPDTASEPAHQAPQEPMDKKSMDKKPIDEEPTDEEPDPQRSIAGRVLDQAGQPLPGIELIARWQRLFQVDQDAPPPPREQKTRSAFDGYYRFDQLADGEYEVRNTPVHDYTSARIYVRAGSDAADLVLAQEREFWAYGLIQNSRGQALAGVQVLASGGAKTVVSDAEGYYELDLAVQDQQQSHLLRYRHDGYQEASVRLGAADWDGSDSIALDIIMEPLAQSLTVAGTIRNIEDLPVSGETVQLHSAALQRRYRAVSDGAGAFLIAEVAPAEDYWLWISPSGAYQDYKKTNLRMSADGLYLEVLLRPLDHGAVVGQMRDLEGNPIPHFGLALRSKDARTKPLQVSGDGQGYYLAEEVPQGRLVFETGSSPHFEVSGVRLPPGGEVEVDLILDWGNYELAGRVLDSSGNPLAVLRIHLVWLHSDNGVRSHSLRQAAADDNGYFYFSQLGPGPHTVSINAPGFAPFQLRHEVGVGPELIELRLEQSSQGVEPLAQRDNN